jgi:hypothetical protein
MHNLAKMALSLTTAVKETQTGLFRFSRELKLTILRRIALVTQEEVS